MLARDGLPLRVAAFGASGPGILLFNGRGEFIERYLPAIAALTERGYRVWTLDWRGQGFSGRMLRDKLLHHVERFETYLDDAEDLLTQHVLPDLQGQPLVLMGHSMGGHLALRLLAQRPDWFAGGILLAPMLDFIRPAGLPRWAARLLAELACLIPGRLVRAGPGTSKTPLLDRPFAANRLTHDEAQYTADLAFQRAHPAVLMGASTWGWLRAALRSIAKIEALPAAALPRLPLLVCIAGGDAIVDSAATRRFVARLTQAEIAEFPGARHDLLRESGAFNAALWPLIDRYLALM
jgi:lysophospholipase